MKNIQYIHSALTNSPLWCARNYKWEPKPQNNFLIYFLSFRDENLKHTWRALTFAGKWNTNQHYPHIFDSIESLNDLKFHLYEFSLLMQWQWFRYHYIIRSTLLHIFPISIHSYSFFFLCILFLLYPVCIVKSNSSVLETNLYFKVNKTFLHFGLFVAKFSIIW